MPNKIQNIILLTLFSTLFTTPLYALEPDEILIIANRDIPASVEIAQYYCKKRNVPVDNILALPLGPALADTISRTSYEKNLAEPIRQKLLALQFPADVDPKKQKNFFAKPIRCLLTTYGVPFKVGPRGQLKGREKKLQQLKTMVEQQKNKLNLLEQNTTASSSHEKKKIHDNLTRLQANINHITGRESNASVDSELSLVLFGEYELYRWQPNTLSRKMPFWDFKSLMVSRLDGPGSDIAKKLVDKALSAEKTNLRGIAYIDSRGIPYDKKPGSFGYYDQSLRQLALYIKMDTEMLVEHESSAALFAPGQCPLTAIYCGWYSLKKYVDAFEFVDGAIGYHIASFEAIDLRDPNSTQWCPAMLVDGVTATLGAVAEPYLHSLPEPKPFFQELFNGRCLVEAYYRTKPFNSWQLLLIGDPLYTPFKSPQRRPPAK